MDCATPDLMKTAKRWLIYMGQTMNDGVLFSKHVPNASEFVYYSDSDWSTQRSTTGGTGQLAGGSIISTSRRQDCTNEVS